MFVSGCFERQQCEIIIYFWWAETKEILEIDHLRYIVDFRSAGWLLYDHRSVANTDTRRTPNILGRGCFISLWRPVRTASALSGSLIRCLAPNMEDSIISSAHRRRRVCVVCYDVAP